MTAPKKPILKDFFSSAWLKGLATTFIGTLLSISLTFGVNSCHSAQQKKADRHLAALMVLGNIETFARNLEVWQKENSLIDTACSVLLSLPQDRVPALSNDSINYYIDLILTPQPTSVSNDETAAKIFSNNIETWKNVGNAMFIQKVGQLFDVINMAKQQLDAIGPQISEFYSEAMTRNQGSPRDAKIAFLQSTGLRQLMMNARFAYGGYTNYTKDYLRYWNKKCMVMIDVTEEEINQHLAGMEQLTQDELNEPKVDNY